MQFCSAISFNHESACVGGELAVGSQLILRGWIYCHVKQTLFISSTKWAKFYNKNVGSKAEAITRMWESKKCHPQNQGREKGLLLQV